MGSQSDVLAVIDHAPLVARSAGRHAVSDEIRHACRQSGFFYVVNHGVDEDLQTRQVKSLSGWIDAPPRPGSFFCNIGDMLDRMTGGFYRSTPHRVRNLAGRDRLSFPFFFDPSFDAEVQPIDPSASVIDDKEQRWDRASVHEFRGTYGDYILAKVSKVFPELRRKVL